MDFAKTLLTLLLVIDPLSNSPIFVAALKNVPPERRRTVILRECLIALLIFAIVFLGGRAFMATLEISPEALRIAGGVMLFIISLRMIFPGKNDESLVLPGESEPFIVPLAAPLLAGPSAIAMIMIISSQYPDQRASVWGAIMVVWLITTVILCSAPLLVRLLKKRGVTAMERLMGMLLITVAVQMFLDGLHLPHSDF
ncbi:MarC family protein [Roseibacillus ishigakijimensis]|uniref:UPF0056 membrane protein n=1 Tax=Roseibacillus ishigakijimensis TaxID=454146 RepID=A0A934RNS9_9BACT|nr:MarC family protein [Roseibacillus ishigakijimensis]MBK1833052.1 NAAT family transporter [Roseibacillus ishigakijimensis]